MFLIARKPFTKILNSQLKKNEKPQSNKPKKPSIGYRLFTRN